MSDAEICERLGHLLGAVVTDLRRLTGGASRDTWRFLADGQPMILQRQRAGSDRLMDVEVEAVRLAHRLGVPVATVVAAGNEALGAAFMVMTAVEGETIARKILRDDEFADARTALPAQLGAALARLHSADAAMLPGATGEDQLTQYRSTFDSFATAHPAFELAFRWLNSHRPRRPRSTVVHGDFRLGNLIVGSEGLRAVLDWELVHTGDPMEDLGWLCVRAWRFGSELPVAGVGSYGQLFAAYEAGGGVVVDPAAVHWWEVMGTLKWGIMCMMQASAHLLGITRSHELAAIGRRVCENEYDVLSAIEAGNW